MNGPDPGSPRMGMPLNATERGDMVQDQTGVVACTREERSAGILTVLLNFIRLSLAGLWTTVLGTPLMVVTVHSRLPVDGSVPAICGGVFER